jgi:DNA primase catalytic core
VYLDGLKERADLAEIIGQHTTVNRRGMAKCPLHDDRAPSLHVDTERGLWCCHGCQRGGDAITFLREIQQCGFREAVDALADLVGIDRWRWRGDEVSSASISRRSAILLAAVEFYESALTDEHRRELNDQRGLLSETLARFRVGYGRPGLRRHLVEGLGHDLEACVAAGVLRSDRGTISEPLQGRFTFPNVHYGRVVHLTGRSRDGGGPKWCHIAGKIEHLFNEPAVRAREVIVVEGPIDCLAMDQLGFRSVALYGTSTDRLLSRDLSRVERLFIALDPDDSGRKGMDTLGQALGFKARIVNMPDGQDPGDFMAGGGDHNSFRALLDQAKTWIELQAEHVAALPVVDRAAGLRLLARETAKADATTAPLIYDIVCSEAQLVSKAEFGPMIEEERARLPAGTGTSDDTPAPISGEERAEAMALLRDPDLLEHMLEDLDRLNSVGEEENKIALYLIMTSRLLPDPASATVKGESSSGKSHTVRHVAKMFPEEAIVEITGMSSKALYHFNEPVAHRVLIVCELPGAEEADYPFRVLQSEKKLVYWVSVKNPETNEWEAKRHELEGPISLIQTTTEAKIHEENATRCFDLFVDETAEQTARIAERQRHSHAAPSVDEEPIVRRWQNAQRLLERLPVQIPFAPQIEFPTDRIRARRDLPRFLALIEASALLHQHQRDRVTINDVEHVVANYTDYEIAFRLSASLLSQSVQGFSPKCAQMVRVAWQLEEQGNGDTSNPQSLSRADIQDRTGKSRNTVDKFMGEAEDAGLIVIKRSPGKANEYLLRRAPAGASLRLLETEELRRRHGAAIDLPRAAQSGVGRVNQLAEGELTEPAQATPDSDCRSEEPTPASDAGGCHGTDPDGLGQVDPTL